MLRRRTLLRSALGGTVLSALIPDVDAAQRTGTGTDYDVLIMGAGVAGLATAAALLRYDRELKVLVLEARERLGGRVHSLRRSELQWSVEMGARYIDAPGGADWPPLKALGLQAEAVEGNRLRLYPSMNTLVRSLADASTGMIQLECIVTEVLWRQGLIGVYYRNKGWESAVTARRMVCALPAPLLREDAAGPRFSPRLPVEKRVALAELSLEPLINVAFMHPQEALSSISIPAAEVWEQRSDSSLLRAQQDGYDGQWLFEVQFRGERARGMAGQAEAQLCAQARQEFAKALGLSAQIEPLWEAAVDWDREPLSRGARSIAGKAALHSALAAPLNNTLFFAGEATAGPDTVGTLHGAYESGERAAEQVAESLGLFSAPILEPM